VCVYRHIRQPPYKRHNSSVIIEIPVQASIYSTLLAAIPGHMRPS